ncbi:hypothetical protein BQ8482_200021 [Mesorhizobium delmotii]|uniref:Uncharacterized protein n=1 Tax=Mesorhizobium delmotii TaxID=1631247 RepID=A0A2P9AKS8_9HYPH|nr:hypothetical protein BQ8482_200021 [Mesorhizobium delmotii]
MAGVCLAAVIGALGYLGLHPKLTHRD